jgi:hypothetical protein
MSRIVTASTVLGTTLVLGLLATPALAAPKDLRVSTATCGGVTVVGQGLPASSQLFLLVRDLRTGKVLSPDGKPIPVRSTAGGAVQARLSLSLRAVRTVDVSIWNKNGETLTMMAKDTAVTNCGTLPLTGAGATARELVVAVALLLAGLGALWRARRPPAPATR